MCVCVYVFVCVYVCVCNGFVQSNFLQSLYSMCIISYYNVNSAVFFYSDLFFMHNVSGNCSLSSITKKYEALSRFFISSNLHAVNSSYHL